jgi:hypothetical protein
MSACISKHGEYSSHVQSSSQGSQRFLCSRCGVMDEAELAEAYDELWEQTLRVHRLSGEALNRQHKSLTVYELNRALSGREVTNGQQ